MWTIAIWLIIGFSTSLLWLWLTSNERRHFWERRERMRQERLDRLTHIVRQHRG